MKILIIGTGWYGCHLAKYLKTRGADITMIDKTDSIFTGSSFKNQNRLHLGYHYPRSSETITECQQGYNRFVSEYPDIREPLENNFYFVSTTLSHMDITTYVTKMEYTKLIDRLPTGLPEIRNVEYPIVQVAEEYINPFRARDYFVTTLSEHLKPFAETGPAPVHTNYDLIINCTYNQYEPIEFECYELFLTLVYRIDTVESFAYTVMDGPFFSIYPYNRDEKLYTVTSVIHGPLYRGRRADFELSEELLKSKIQTIEQQIKEYIPEFCTICEYQSHYVSWKTKHASTTDDRTVRHQLKGNMLTIYGGKITGIFQAEQILENVLSNRSAIIGWTGFVGQTLTLAMSLGSGLIDLYNSRNIDDICGERYGTVYVCGMPAEKWRINQEPEKDYAVLTQLIRCLKTIKVSRIVLISTVDVLDCTIPQDEDGETYAVHPYGRHRRILEEFIGSNFADHHIIRLPGLFGKGLKKNIIYDLLNSNNIESINPDSVFQWYNISNLASDIDRCISEGIRLIHLVTEPISVQILLDRYFYFPEVTVKSVQSSPVVYRLTSRFKSSAIEQDLQKYIETERQGWKFIPVVSNIAWDREDEPDVMKILKRYGINHIETAFPKLAATPVSAVTGAPVVSCQSIFYGKKIETKEQFIDHYKHVASSCASHGIKIIVFGSPTIRHIVANDIELFRKVGDISEEYGVTFCIEPNAKAYGACWLNILKETIDFVKSVSHPCIKVNFDLGNYVMEDDTSGVEPEYIGHIQISAPFLAPLTDAFLKKYKQLLAPLEYQNRYVSLEMKRSSMLDFIKSVETFCNLIKE